jgi:hypothetical protein
MRSERPAGTAAATGVVPGGRNLYGLTVGMLMTESHFPRIPGDNGNAATWPFPVAFRVVQGASPGRVVRSLDDGSLLEPFVDAAQGLERAGVELITTSCGFLVLFQRQMQSRIQVPFLSSSLLQVPWVAAILPAGRRVEAGGYFVDTILGDRAELDVDRARAEHIAAAQALLERAPEVGAIVLECTNMPPYRDAVRRATGLPVFDLTTLVGWAVASISAGAWELGYGPPATMRE